MLRLALEDNVGEIVPEVKTEEGTTILMKGPLSEIYTKALDIAYAKDPIDSKTGVSLESKTDKKSKVKKGSFHEWLGKKPDETITDADIEKGLKSDDKHVKKMAQFAKNAKKWHEKGKKKKKLITEEFDGLALETIELGFIKQISTESQQMDAAIMQQISDSIEESGETESTCVQTVYGVSQDDVNENTIVDVTSELAKQNEEDEFVIIIDATKPPEDAEQLVNLTSALECLVTSHKGLVFHSLKDYVTAMKDSNK